jgi:bifunctional DNA-binding transcriptional regulator/antitoxin component of YhaV-PrlF toxin-antitoxin module
LIPAGLRKKYRLEEGVTVVFDEDHGRLTLEPSNFAAFFALQGTLGDYPLEETLTSEREAERAREDER